MSKIRSSIVLLTIGAIAFGALSGCSGSSSQVPVTTDYEQALAQRDQEIDLLRGSLDDQSRKIENLQAELMTAQQAREKAYADMESLRAQDAATGDLFPPAKPGECYTRVFVPATYEQVSEQILHKAATSTVKATAPKYEWVEQQVLVEPASFRLEPVPAQYEWREERVLVREARTEWRRGRGPIERVDETTGEIMCLIEVPAEYRTVRKQVEVSGATTKRVEIPAKYETVKVRQLVAEAREERVDIPAEYQTVTRWVKTADGHMEWRRIMCETNMTNEMVKRLQTALRDKGHDPGPIDGIIGLRTTAALHSFQKSLNLPVGGVTYETIEGLGL